MDKGSIRGSIFALCASAIGAGVLSLPYVFNMCGYAMGILMICTVACAAEISLRMLGEIAVVGNFKSYSSICIEAGGKPLNFLLSLMILLFMFGCCISYQVMITSMT